MAIIRNDRRAREEQAETQKAADEGDQMVTDYSWRPSLEEFDPKLSVDDWKALLDDPTVFDEDGLHAVECLHEIGGPTTLQQLSVRYRGTMGRYRRWLNTAGERVGRHLGADAPAHDQFGNEEWWPFIYQRRGIGKVAANQHELRLRDELGAALDAREAEKKQARHREEQNQAKERERQVRAQAEALRSSNAKAQSGTQREAHSTEPNAAERRRAAEEARAAREARLSQITVDRTTESVPDMDAPAPEEPKPAMTKAQAAVAARIAAAQKRAGAQVHSARDADEAIQDSAERQPVAQGSTAMAEEPVAAVPTASEAADSSSASVASEGHVASRVESQLSAGAAAATPAKEASAQRESLGAEALPSPSAPALPLAAFHEYLSALNAEYPEGRAAASPRSRKRHGRATAATSERDIVHLPLDYAVRYSNRAWAALDLMGEASPTISAARIARLAGCDSVEPIQQLLNGDEVPSFALVDDLCQTLGLNREYLESTDAEEPELPVFATVQELAEQTPLGQLLGGKPTDIYILKTNDDHQRATALVRFGSLRALLLDRHGAELGAQDADSPVREDFLALVHALQEYALSAGVGFENVALSPKEWRALQGGRTWPGALV